MGQAVKKPKRPSGPTQSAESRRAAGRVQLATWLSSEAAAKLRALSEAWQMTKREVIELLLHGAG